MAKYYNPRVKTGRLAGSVFAVRFGETIERAYQPVVYNPKTPAQVGSRARMKLMSQMAAIMATVIAIPREGSVSSRNLFVKKNYRLTSYANDTANIEMGSIQLTDSVVSLPNIVATRAENNLSVGLASPYYDVTRVVYVVFTKSGDELRYRLSSVVSEAGDSGRFQTTIPSSNVEEIVYAYGIRDNNENARVIFGNLTVPTAQSIAKLVVTRTITLGDVTLTETKSATVAAANANMREENAEVVESRGKKTK